MALFSFDIVSDYDKAELNNVVDQAQREVAARYDFKGTPAALNWLDGEKTGLQITGNSQYQLDAILDIIRKKLAARGQSQKVLNVSQEPITSNLKITQTVTFQRGLTPEKSKQLTGLLREACPKVKTHIQGDAIRVSSSSKNDLQAAIAAIQAVELDFPISFINYR